MKKKRDVTRTKILEAALRMFRKRGFERTTMRDVAEAAGVALGAAYYYFPSKDALVLAYYVETQNTHSALAREAMKTATTFEARVSIVLHTKIDSLARDRKLLSALFRSVADPSNELSIFSARTKTVRDESVALFAEALAVERLAPALDETLTLALWSLSMGIVLFFIHDTSPEQKKTRALVDGTVTLVSSMMPMAPLLSPMAESVRAVLRDAGLA